MTGGPPPGRGKPLEITAPGCRELPRVDPRLGGANEFRAAHLGETSRPSTVDPRLGGANSFTAVTGRGKRIGEGWTPAWAGQTMGRPDLEIDR